jgi:hypothetical protein
MRSLFLTIVAGLLLTTACAQSPAGSRPAGDIGYCNRLADLYERYIGRSQDAPSRPNLGGSLDADVAAARCRQGNPSGIPALERVLRNNGFSLPPRS